MNKENVSERPSFNFGWLDAKRNDSLDSRARDGQNISYTAFAKLASSQNVILHYLLQNYAAGIGALDSLKSDIRNNI